MDPTTLGLLLGAGLLPLLAAGLGWWARSRVDQEEDRADRLQREKAQADYERDRAAWKLERDQLRRDLDAAKAAARTEAELGALGRDPADPDRRRVLLDAAFGPAEGGGRPTAPPPGAPPPDPSA